MPTPFQQSVWNAIKKIPKGKLTTYSEIANYLGKPKATRAVGTACGKNPNVPSTPCHRVITKNGLIGNYSGPGGTQGKIKILQKEGITIENGRIKNVEELIYKLK
ncbi:MAG: MGMT family protein [Patescibacteria group bacterium]